MHTQSPCTKYTLTDTDIYTQKYKHSVHIQITYTMYTYKYIHNVQTKYYTHKVDTKFTHTNYTHKHA